MTDKGRGLSPTRRYRRVTAVAVLAALLLSTQAFEAALAGPPATLPPVNNADGRLGLCDVLPGSPLASSQGPTWAALTQAAGARVNRWEFRWDKEEPSPFSWDFSSMDPAVQSSLGSGLQVEGILIGTPAWAAGAGQRPGNGVPRGLYLPASDPANLWADYVRVTVGHYGGKVRYWEIWNEPDLKFYWMGSTGDYYRLVKVASQVIKEVDPGAHVLLGGMVEPSMRFFTDTLAYARDDWRTRRSSAPFDAVAWHVYGNAASAYTNVTRMRALLSGVGYGRMPIWVTEDGFPASNPNGEPRQAAYVFQTIAYALAAGAARVLVYRASDDVGSKQWGILTAAGTPRMAYASLQTAARYFARASAVAYSPAGRTERFVFYEPSKRVTVLWSRGTATRTVALSVDASPISVATWQGQQPAATLSGFLHLQVPGASYNSGIDPSGAVVGGPPVLLLQNNVAPGGLPGRGLLPSLASTGRRVALFNSTAESVTADVANVSDAREHQLLHLAPRSVTTVDLDLLGGSWYAGGFSLRTSRSIPVVDVGGTSATTGGASRTWFLPAASSVLAITNSVFQATNVSLSAFTGRGKLRLRTVLKLGALGRSQWSLPHRLARQGVSLVVRASHPVTVTSAPAAPHTETEWYLSHPSGGRVAVFNPTNRGSVSLVIRTAGSKPHVVQARVRSHRTALIRVPGSGWTSVSAGAGVVVSSPRSSSVTMSRSGVTQRAAFALAGNLTHLAVYNPGARPAHIALTHVAGTQATARTLTVRGGQGTNVGLRGVSASAGGVILTSDVPVAAKPTG